MGQGHQPVGQQLQGPAFTAVWGLALGQRGQDGLDFVIDLGPAPCPREFVQCPIQTAVDKLATGSQDRVPTGVQGSDDLLLAFALVRHEQDICPFDFPSTWFSFASQFDQGLLFVLGQVNNVSLGHEYLLPIAAALGDILRAKIYLMNY
jgi:hypothetical protein